jgi:hypothetical protein
MLFANLMFPKVSTTQLRFLLSGSEYSEGPAYVSLVQEVDAPKYPSNSEYSPLFRFWSTPHALRLDGIPLVAVIGQ